MSNITSSKNFDLIWAREHTGLTQAQAAKLLTEAGLPTTPLTICRWETGATEIPRRKWFKVLEVFKLTQADIPKHTPAAEPARVEAPAVFVPGTSEDRREGERRDGERRAPVVEVAEARPLPVDVNWVLAKVRMAQTGADFTCGWITELEKINTSWLAGVNLTYNNHGYPNGWPVEKLREIDTIGEIAATALKLLEGAAHKGRQSERDRLKLAFLSKS